MTAGWAYALRRCAVSFAELQRWTGIARDRLRSITNGDVQPTAVEFGSIFAALTETYLALPDDDIGKVADRAIPRSQRPPRDVVRAAFDQLLKDVDRELAEKGGETRQ